MENFLSRLDAQVEESWAALAKGNFWRHVLEHGFDHELYTTLMREIYHYTRHNAQNQALAAVGVNSERVALLRFCLHHAYEEAGHDGMVLRDLEKVGVVADTVKASKPLPETEAFISYLYRVSRDRDATARLGYSYWAENCYGYIAEILDAMRRDLDLDDKKMTFFVAHAEIDTEHFEEVQKIALSECTTAELQEGMLEVLRTTLHLQGQMLEAVYQAYRGATEAVAA